MTCSGLPTKRLRSTGSCVATPTGQVLRWHLRIITQPMAISGAVAKPNSSAPSSAPTTTSRPGADAAVHLHPDAAAQPVQNQRLLRFGKSDFPRAPGVLDGGERRSAGPAFEAGDGDMIGPRLRDARRHRAHTDFGAQLDADFSARIDVLEVEDELRQILDRIDVVVRRRRDQADARRRVTHLGDDRVHLVSGQLSALARLGALHHLDLDHVGVDEVFRRHPKATGRHLLDRGALRIAVGHGPEALGFLAALAGVRLAADPVHGDGQGGVRLAADRAERHGARGEPLDDVDGGLDFG